MRSPSSTSGRMAGTAWSTVAVLVALSVAGCATRPAGDPSRGASTVAGPSSSTETAAAPLAGDAAAGPLTSDAAADATEDARPAASSSEGTESGEEIIRAFIELDQEGDETAALEAFLAQHPALATAEAKPYGRALMWALEFEHADAALVLIRAGAQVTRAKPRESDPIHLAARGGLDEVVEELLARGASARGSDHWGTPLHFAAKHGHVSTMELLLRAGADPSAHAPDHQYTPLHAAVIDRRVEAVRVLIRAKADLEARDDDGRTPLHWGGFAYRQLPVHRYSRMGGPHDTTFEDPGPAIAMKLLLDAGAKIEALDNRGNTPLHEAAAVGSRRGVELLLSRGARRNVKNHAGESPLFISKRRGDDDIVKMLSGRR